MKVIINLWLICCVILIISNTFVLALNGEPSSSSKQSESVKIGHPTDGVAIMMGVYSPFQSEMKGVYSGAFTISGQYCLNMSRSIDLLGLLGYTHSEGNPYYDDLSFTSGGSSTINIIPIEMSIRKRFVFMKEPARGLFAGVGINYIRVTEKMPDIVSASGGDFGMHLFVGPQIFIRNNLAFEGEVKLLMNEIDMKDSSLRYPLTLSGLTIKAGLSWYY
jgi:hypothetical protein